MKALRIEDIDAIFAKEREPLQSVVDVLKQIVKENVAIELEDSTAVVEDSAHAMMGDDRKGAFGMIQFWANKREKEGHNISDAVSVESNSDVLTLAAVESRLMLLLLGVYSRSMTRIDHMFEVLERRPNSVEEELLKELRSVVGSMSMHITACVAFGEIRAHSTIMNHLLAAASPEGELN